MTRHDLIAVRKKGLGWVNIDSQAPNKIAREWLETQEYDKILGEYVLSLGCDVQPDSLTVDEDRVAIR